jgi:WD40 repeat protein
MRLKHRLSLLVLGSLVFLLPIAAEQPAPPNLVIALRGHKEAVYGITFSPDGKQILTASGDPSVKVWDLATGKDLKTYAGPDAHKQIVLGVAISPDGATFATSSGDNSVRIWDFPTDKPLHSFDLPSDSASVAVNADGKLVSAGTVDGKLRIWNSDGKSLFDVSGHTGALNGLSFVPNGNLLVSSGADGTLRFWNSTDGKPTDAFGAHSTPVVALAVSPNANAAYTLGTDGTLKFWTMPPKQSKQLHPPAGPITQLVLSSDGTRALTVSGKTIRIAKTGDGGGVKELAAPADITALTHSTAGVTTGGTADGRVVLWSGKEASPDSFLAHNKTVTGVALSAAGNQFITTSADGMVKMWTLSAAPRSFYNPGRLVSMPEGKRFVFESASFQAHPGGVSTLALHPNGTQFLTGGADKTVKMWTLATGNVDRTFGPLAEPVSRVALSRDGVLIAASAGKKVTVWNSSDGKEAFSLESPALVKDVAFNADRTRLATAGDDGKVRVWDVATRQEQVAFLHTGAASGVAFHPANPVQVISTGADGVVALDTIVFARAVSVGPAKGLAITPGGNQLLTAGVDGKVKAWNAGSGALERTFDVGEKPIVSVAASRNAVQVAAASADNKVRIFNANDGKLIGLFTSPAEVRALGYTANSQTLLACCADGSVPAWNVVFNPGQPVSAEFGKVTQSFAGQAVASAFPPTGTNFYTASGKAVKVWRLAAETATKQFAGGGPMSAVAFNPAGTLLAGVNGDSRLRIFDIAKGAQAKETAPIGEPAKPVAMYTVAWSPDGSQVATGCLDGAVRLWNPTSGALVRTFGPFKKDATKGHQDAVLSVAFSPDGKQLASGGMDRSIFIWNVADGAVVRELANPGVKPGVPGTPPAAHPGWVYALTWLKDGRIVSAGGAPRLHGYLAVWEAGSGKLVSGEELAVGTVFCLAVSPDAKLVALGTGGSVRQGPELNQGVVLKLPGGK